jgi:predicted SprT family Zn-dependent metalloprotease
MITKTQFQMLDDLYTYYNKALFDGKLPDCMIITSRRKRAKGTFISQNWTNRKKKTDKDETPSIHEISLNPDYLDRKDEEWQSTLVHEMIHLWQQEFGKPSRANYHNKQWALKMEELGLMPSNTGEPGGKKTGQGMTHYIIPGGKFIEAFKNLKDKNIKYVSSTLLGEKKPGSTNTRSKTKYTCQCDNSVWGKPGLDIICADCNTHYEQSE